MKILEYPLLCHQLNAETVLGHLLGTHKQLVATDVRSLTGDFSGYIEKQLRDGTFYEPDLKAFRLRTFSFAVRPHYQENERMYPVKEPVEVPVHAVYGNSENGYFECFLPVFGKSFYFYAEKDLEKLVEHFSRDAFHNMAPAQVYQLLQQTTPWLETVSVKSPTPKERKVAYEADYGSLPGIAEKLPFPRRESGKPVVDAAWEQGELADSLVSMLLDEKANVLLTGNSGTGKSAVIREVIRKITGLEKSKDKFERHTFWRTSPSRMTAKARYLGEWQQICEEMTQDLQRNNGIVWMENFVSLALTGGEGPEDSVAAFLTSFIRQGQLQLISEVTPPQLEALRRLLPGFAEHFRIVKLEEMDARTTLRIFEYFNQFATRHYSITFSQQALEMSYVLLDRFVRYEGFPGKAIRFLSHALSKAQLSHQQTLGTHEVIENFSEQTGIPDFLLRDDQPLDAAALRLFFSQRIKGQDQVIDHLASLIRIFKAGLNDPGKPIATLVFAGPTGVGKTATAKAIAAYFFGIGQAYQPLIRLDMSEFQHPAQIYRLIGSDGKLVQFVREKPFCVVLLDEIEKAHPLIFDALLTVLDEGILLDSAGRLTDFRNTIIIMTSNLGSVQSIAPGFKSHQTPDFEADIRSFFRPEFFNRIDQVLPFLPLTATNMHDILLQELAALENRDGIRNRHLKLHFTENLIALLAEKGFDQKYGARPLQREIERRIVAPLARLLLENPLLHHQLLQADAENEQVIFRILTGI